MSSMREHASPRCVTVHFSRQSTSEHLDTQVVLYTGNLVFPVAGQPRGRSSLYSQSDKEYVMVTLPEGHMWLGIEGTIAYSSSSLHILRIEEAEGDCSMGRSYTIICIILTGSNHIIHRSTVLNSISHMSVHLCLFRWKCK